MASTQGSSGTTPPEGGGTSGSGSPTAGTSTAAHGSDSGPRWLWPVVAFVVGLLLGGSAIAALQAGSDDDSPVAVASPSPSASPAAPSAGASPGPTDLLVRVPSTCLELSDQSEAAFRDVDDVAAAVRDFNASRLQQLVDRFQDVRPTIEQLATSCRNASTDSVVDGTVTSPAPALTAPAS